jgi:hypothetical protein
VHFALLFSIFEHFYELKVLGSNGTTILSVGETTFSTKAFCHLERIINFKPRLAGSAF